MIVVADTCACGLAAIPGLRSAAPQHGLRYFADFAANPLGQMSDAAILHVVKRWAEFAARTPGAQALVLACNTASVVLARHPGHDLGAVPIVTMVDAFSIMVRRSPLAGRRILLLGTKATIGSGVYAGMLRHAGAGLVHGFAATRTEAVVAGGHHASAAGRAEVRAELAPLAGQAWDAVILGCSCFGHVREVYRELFGAGISLHDPLDHLGEALALRLGGEIGLECMALVELAASGSKDECARLLALARACLKGVEIRLVLAGGATSLVL